MHYKSRIFLSSCAVLLALASLASPVFGEVSRVDPNALPDPAGGQSGT